MMNNFTKISGWLLFFIGFFIIVFAVWHSYNIIFAKAEIPDFFQTPEETKNVPAATETQDVQVLLQKAMQDQLKGFFPPDIITKSLNLFAWATLALILMSGGSKISDLGIRLIKIGQEKNEHA
ncbi:MAG: hypothetical protein NTZ84_03470 [Candidatus Nealsonbacteria bacterium]|nr:hypothetical protein [Candidatus Nealsonbacteria bacterium]